MYVVSPNGILLYEGIDKRDAITNDPKPLSNELLNYQLSPGTIDCSPYGLIVFDTKRQNQANPQHHLKSFNKHRSEDKYDFALEGEKKMIKFYKNYIIEVKTERQDQERI